MRYAKRGRAAFTSHRDISRAVERAVRRAGIPVAYSAGFTPRPKISYAGAASTGVASEAEYLEIAVASRCDPDWVCQALDASLPTGLDVLEVVEARGGSLPERLEASLWEARLKAVGTPAAQAAVDAFLAADAVEVERLTKKGRRRFDARSAVVSLTARDADDQPDRRAGEYGGVRCAILRMVVRRVTPAVRPDDVLAALRHSAALAPPSPESVPPPTVTRLAQGPLDVATGKLGDPLAPDRDGRAVPSGTGAPQR